MNDWPNETALCRVESRSQRQILILIVGGLFLLARSTREVHEKLKGDEKKGKRLAAPFPQLRSIQIMLLNVIFSLDSVITAVGMVDQIPVMIAGSSSPSS